MKKPSKKKLSFALTALLVLFLLSAYAWYTRPVTLPALYPMLKPEQCTQIQGYYEIGMQPEQSNFTITKDSAEFEQLWDLFYDQSYRRSLKDLLPRGTMIFNGRSMFSLRTLHFPTEAPAPARCCILPIGTVPLNYFSTERRTFTGFLNRSAGPLRSLRSYSEHQTAERKIGGVP